MAVRHWGPLHDAGVASVSDVNQSSHRMVGAIWHSTSGGAEDIDLAGALATPRVCWAAWMDRKPVVDELLSPSRPIALYAMRWHENDR